MRYIEKVAGEECISTSGGGGEPLRKEPCVCLVHLVHVDVRHSEEEGTRRRSSRSMLSGRRIERMLGASEGYVGVRWGIVLAPSSLGMLSVGRQGFRYHMHDARHEMQDSDDDKLLTGCS